MALRVAIFLRLRTMTSKIFASESQLKTGYIAHYWVLEEAIFNKAWGNSVDLRFYKNAVAL